MEVSNENLFEWANKLASGHNVLSPSEPLTPSHFMQLTNNKSLRPILSYLVEHVRPNTEARKIRLNLKHARIKKHLVEQTKESSLVDKRLSLKASIMEVRSAINIEVKELQDHNEQKESLLNKEKELNRKLSLINLACSSYSNEITKYKQDNGQLQNIFPQRQMKSIKNEELGRKAKEDLTTTLTKIEHLRSSALCDEDPETLHQLKVDVWGTVNNQLELYPPPILLTSLISLTREANMMISEAIDNVNIVRDARQLRLKCENDGTFIDEANEGGVLESVRGMLIEMSGSHVKSYLEATQIKQAIKSLGRASESLYNNIQTAAKRSYKDSEVCEELMNLAEESIHLAGDKAALAKCQELISTHRKRVEVAHRAKDALLRKQEKIFKFNDEVKNGLKQIKSLVQSINSNWDILCTKSDSLYIKINEAEKSLVLPTPHDQDNLSHEFGKVQKLPLDLLYTMDVLESKTSKCHLSTCGSPLETDKNLILQGLDESLVMNEKYAQAIFDKKQMKHTLSSDLTRATILQHQIVQSNSQMPNMSSGHIKGLCKKVDDFDTNLSYKIEPLIKRCETHLDTGLHLVGQMDTLIQNWWEQPGQQIETLPVNKG